MSQETSVAVQVPAWPAYSGQTYAQLTEGAAVAPGAELVSGDLLVGVPFVITHVTFRTGDFVNAGTKTRGAYASAEILTGDQAAFAKALKRGRITAECSIDTEEELVFNEGGTGVYRQLVRTWEGFGWITLPDGPDQGPYGATRLDTPLSGWKLTSGAPVEAYFDAEGDPVLSAPCGLHVKRGLRVSEYENEYTREGRTRYLA